MRVELALNFAVTGLTRAQPQPSARFPWIDYRSRNRSPPIELYRRKATAGAGGPAMIDFIRSWPRQLIPDRKKPNGQRLGGARLRSSRQVLQEHPGHRRSRRARRLRQLQHRERHPAAVPNEPDRRAGRCARDPATRCRPARTPPDRARWRTVPPRWSPSAASATAATSAPRTNGWFGPGPGDGGLVTSTGRCQLPDCTTPAISAICSGLNVTGPTPIVSAASCGTLAGAGAGPALAGTGSCQDAPMPKLFAALISWALVSRSDSVANAVEQPAAKSVLNAARGRAPAASDGW